MLVDISGSTHEHMHWEKIFPQIPEAKLQSWITHHLLPSAPHRPRQMPHLWSVDRSSWVRYRGPRSYSPRIVPPLQLLGLSLLHSFLLLFQIKYFVEMYWNFSCQLSWAWIMEITGRIRDLWGFFRHIGHDPKSLLTPDDGEISFSHFDLRTHRTSTGYFMVIL